MNNKAEVIRYLNDLNISFELYEHPPVPTVEEALPYWKDIDAAHCKNLFFRNHKQQVTNCIFVESISCNNFQNFKKTCSLKERFILKS